jgi:hypothetical protein
MARARLQDRHQENLYLKLEMLKVQQGVGATGAEETGDGAEMTVKAEPGAEMIVKAEPDSHSEAASIHESSDSETEEKG